MVFYNCDICGILTKESIILVDSDKCELKCKNCGSNCIPDFDNYGADNIPSEELVSEITELAMELTKTEARDNFNLSLKSLEQKGIIRIFKNEKGEEMVELTELGKSVADKLGFKNDKT